jgi:hypothetical protein
MALPAAYADPAWIASVPTDVCSVYQLRLTLSSEVNFTPWHAYEGIEGRQRYISNSFATSVLEGDGCLVPGCGRLTPDRNPLPIVPRSDGSRGSSEVNIRNLSHDISQLPQQTVLRWTTIIFFLWRNNQSGAQAAWLLRFLDQQTPGRTLNV